MTTTKNQFGLEEEKTHVSLKADPSVPIGLFRPHPKLVGIYLAHPDTIFALKKDIAIDDPELIKAENLLNCKKCNKTWDIQFWRLCPFCKKALI